MGVRSGFGPLQEPGGITCCSHTNCLQKYLVKQEEKGERYMEGRKKRRREEKKRDRRGMGIRKEGQNLDEREKLTYR